MLLLIIQVVKLNNSLYHRRPVHPVNFISTQSSTNERFPVQTYFSGVIQLPCLFPNWTGLICAEGKQWREQRSFVTSTLKTLGMVKVGATRERLEERIMEGVFDAVEVT